MGGEKLCESDESIYGGTRCVVSADQYGGYRCSKNKEVITA